MGLKRPVWVVTAMIGPDEYVMEIPAPTISKAIDKCLSDLALARTEKAEVVKAEIRGGYSMALIEGLG